MYKPHGLDRKSLQIQLENCKIITEVNMELLDKNLFIKEELSGKLKLAQTYISESRQWEELDDQNKCHESLKTAGIIIMEISIVIKHLLTQDTSSADHSLQLDQSSA